MVRITLTRDSVCMADDIAAPHGDSVTVADTASLREIACAVMRGSYLAYLNPTATWHVAAGGGAVVFGKYHFLPFIDEIGDCSIMARDLTALHFGYHAQRSRADVCRTIADQLARTGNAAPSRPSG